MEPPGAISPSKPLIQALGFGAAQNLYQQWKRLADQLGWGENYFKLTGHIQRHYLDLAPEKVNRFRPAPDAFYDLTPESAGAAIKELQARVRITQALATWPADMVKSLLNEVCEPKFRKITDIGTALDRVKPHDLATLLEAVE